ncbi:MAG: class I SAM-dependent methyltransferase [Patescibacteria group bacterium]|nr:class I SAM-dependent methyltransferase [Patescibacteria group bacterium]
MDHVEFFLEKFSSVYPYSHCVWRIDEAAALASFLPFKETTFDLGCGDGSYMKLMQECVGRPTKMIGLDPQAHEVAKAKKLGIYDELIVGYSNAIPLPDASVDMVFSNSVVEHIQDKAGTIKEVARILKPEGVYLFSAPSENFTPWLRFGTWGGRKTWLNRLWTGAINGKFKHYWLQSPESWRKDLEEVGLELVAARYTLTDKNLGEWERWLIPSYLQHLPAKRFGWVPLAGFFKRRLVRRLSDLHEPEALAAGGNIIICARKKV